MTTHRLIAVIRYHTLRQAYQSYDLYWVAL